MCRRKLDRCHKQRNALPARVTYITLTASRELLGQSMKKAILIGIAGASGSGKTLVANRIIESPGLEKAIVIQEVKPLPLTCLMMRKCNLKKEPEGFN